MPASRSYCARWEMRQDPRPPAVGPARSCARPPGEEFRQSGTRVGDRSPAALRPAGRYRARPARHRRDRSPSCRNRRSLGRTRRPCRPPPRPRRSSRRTRDRPLTPTAMSTATSFNVALSTPATRYVVSAVTWTVTLLPSRCLDGDRVRGLRSDLADRAVAGHTDVSSRSSGCPPGPCPRRRPARRP